MSEFFLRLLLRLLDPIAIVWLGLILLTVVLRRRRQTIPFILSLLLTLLITILGGTDFSSWLLYRMERPWVDVKHIELPHGDAVVVLGGGAEPSRNDIGRVRMTKAGDRILTGLELMRWGLAPALVIGGGVVRVNGVDKIESDLVRTRIGDWKPPSVWEVISLGLALDTHDEALRLVPIAKQRAWRRIILVTSASHMRRAVSVYRAAGFEVIPAPSSFIVAGNASSPSFGMGIPSWSGFERFSIWFREYAGWKVYHRKGWLASE